MKKRLSWLALALVAPLAISEPAAAQESGIAVDAEATLAAPWAPPTSGEPQQTPQQGGVSGLTGRFSALERNAPDREDRTLINVGTEHVNAIFGGIGQGAGLTGGIQLTTADDLPGVELSASALVSWKLYYMLETEAYFPEVGSEDTHAMLRFRYKRRPKDNFFGLGPDVGSSRIALVAPVPGFPTVIEVPPFSSEAYEVNYDLEQRQFSGALFHDVSDRLQVGAYVQYVNSDVYEGDDDEDPVISTFFVPYGVPVVRSPQNAPLTSITAVPVPGLFTGSKILTEGIYAEFDGRDTDDGLTTGFYAYGRITNNDGVGEIEQPGVAFPFQTPVPPAFFRLLPSNLNDYGWIGFVGDVRGYLPIYSDRTVLALRYFTELNEIKGGSAIPFYDLSKLGGGSTLRGFDTFRFYGRNSVLFQGELRLHVWQFQGEEDKGLALVVFGDAGEVWGLPFETLRTVGTGVPVGIETDGFEWDNIEADAGGGAWFLWDDFVLRTEIAFSNEKTRFIFGFGRSF